MLDTPKKKRSLINCRTFFVSLVHCRYFSCGSAAIPSCPYHHHILTVFVRRQKKKNSNLQTLFESEKIEPVHYHYYFYVNKQKKRKALTY